MTSSPARCAFILFCLMVAASAFADSFWLGPDPNGGVPGEWIDGVWNGGLPSFGNAAYIGSGGTNEANGTTTISLATGTATTGTLTLGQNPGNTGTLYINGGSLSLNSSATTNGTAYSFSVGGNGQAGGAGTLMMDGGTVTLSVGTTSVSQFVLAYSSGNQANGYMEMKNGGMVNFLASGNNKFSIAVRGTGTLNMTATAGTINLNGGSFDVSRGAGVGTVFLNGGTITAGNFNIASTSGGAGTVLIDGGQLTTTSTTHSAQGNGGSAYLKVNSGTFTSGSTFTLAEDTNTNGNLIVTGTGRVTVPTLNVSAGSLGSKGTVLVDGGTLTATAIAVSNGNINGGSPAGTLNMQNGTLNVTNAITIASSGTANFGYAKFSGGVTNTASFLIASGTGTGVFGTMLVTGGRINTGSIFLNSSGNTPVGNGTFDLEGGTVVATGRLDLNRVSGGNGTFIMNQTGAVPTELCVATATFVNTPAKVAFNGGTLTVGTFALSNPSFGSAMVLSPGDFTTAGGGTAYGTTNVRGSTSAQGFTMTAGSSLHMDIGSTSATHDTVMLWNGATSGGVGNAVLNANSFIDIEFHGDTDNPPAIGTTWDLIVLSLFTTAGNITDNATLRWNTPGWTFSKSIVAGDGVSTDKILRLRLDAVPEPSVAGLICIMTGALLRRRPRRRMASRLRPV